MSETKSVAEQIYDMGIENVRAEIEKRRDKWMVKVKRIYGDYEATSVLAGPYPKKEAEKVLLGLQLQYQDPGAYYMERYDPELYGQGFSKS